MHVQVDFAVDDHRNKVMGFLLIQQNVNWNVAGSCFQKIRKNVNICERVHHHSNNLKQKSKYTRKRVTSFNEVLNEDISPSFLTQPHWVTKYTKPISGHMYNYN